LAQLAEKKPKFVGEKKKKKKGGKAWSMLEEREKKKKKGLEPTGSILRGKRQSPREREGREEGERPSPLRKGGRGRATQKLSKKKERHPLPLCLEKKKEKGEAHLGEKSPRSCRR